MEKGKWRLVGRILSHYSVISFTVSIGNSKLFWSQRASGLTLLSQGLSLTAGSGGSLFVALVKNGTVGVRGVEYGSLPLVSGELKLHATDSPLSCPDSYIQFSTQFDQYCNAGKYSSCLQWSILLQHLITKAKICPGSTQPQEK